ncbi:MAG: aspartate carbamoyltransferase catalytic subunit [Bdellovibrionaceae bacterium]|nr:aspartate carbamoyltransferase catalytic subunit [Pseudobdellovibrionaceae bacterium]
MSFYGRSFLSTQNLSLEKINKLFSLSKRIKEEYKEEHSYFLPEWHEQLRNKVVILAFFEPSTRTLLSFQMASQRLQLRTVTFPSISESSLIKGETLVDTIMNLEAMEPNLFIFRTGDSQDLLDCIKSVKVPVLNAGSGSEGHPTQALLDAFTIQERLGSVAGQKILFVGDVIHSRVASSNLELFKLMGAEMAICGPNEMLPKENKWQGIPTFKDLEKGLEWANVCMGLRVQLERHEDKNALSKEEYSKNYCINLQKLKKFTPIGLIMHPGPFIRGLDFDPEVLSDKRCVVHEQVTHGVYIRAALIAKMLVKGVN